MSHDAPRSNRLTRQTPALADIWQAALVGRKKRHSVERARQPGGWRRARRTGITALALVAATVTASLVLARGYHLGVAAIVIAILGGIPGLYLTWAAYRDDRVDAGGEQMGLASVADELAGAVRAQWEAEAAIRHLNDPLLPIQWVPADQQLSGSWDSLVALAATGVGWPAPPSTGTWASGTAALAGEGRDIAGVLARIPTRRMVILGEPGAGKTMLLVRLVLDLLAHRTPGAPVPILVSMASWDPNSQDLHQWLADQMTVDHPALRAPATEGSVSGSRAWMLLTHRYILPVLDGLDELPESSRAAAISGINDALRPGEAVVVSSRIEAYRTAVRRPNGAVTTLRGGAVIEIQPVDPATATRYLLHDDSDAGRWAPVLAALGTSSPAGRALATPLMLSLARAVYSPASSAPGAAARDPAELCRPDVTSLEAVREHLLDAFIPAAYRQPPSTGGVYRIPWTAAEAAHWLAFLAHHLEETVASPGFAWWHLEDASPRLPTRAGAVMTSAIGFVLALAFMSGALIPISAKLTAAASAGLASGLATWILGMPQTPITGVGWSLRFAASPSVWLRAWRLHIGVAIALARITFPVLLVLTVLVFGFAAAPAWLLVGIAAVGVYGVYEDLAEVATPRAVLAREQRALLLLGLVAMMYSCFGGFVLGTALGRAIKVIFGISQGPVLGAASGLAFGASIILGLGLAVTSYSRWRLTAGWLATRHQLPWRLLTFLDDAHRRGVLRQAGAFYQFRHIELQHQLAAEFKARAEIELDLGEITVCPP